MTLMTLCDAVLYRCPTDPRRVSVVENGESLRARFTALAFSPGGSYVFLHCRVSLCDYRSYNCRPVSETLVLSLVPKIKIPF